MSFNVNLNTTKIDTTSDINNVNIDSLNKANNGNQIDGTVLPNVKKDSTVPFESCSMPSLDTPSSSVSSSTYSTALSALGEILVLLNKVNSEQVAQNRQLQYENLMACAENLEKKADKMKEGAVAALVCKVVSGAISIGIGAYSLGSSIRSFSKFNETVNNLKQDFQHRTFKLEDPKVSVDEMLNKSSEFTNATNALRHSETIAQSVSQIAQGASKVVEGTGDYLSTMSNVEVKRIESQGEKMRASNESLKAITEKLEETIKKAMEVFQSLSQGQIELTKRING